MDNTISLGQAFAHCASTGTYWRGIIIVLAVAIGLVVLVWQVQKKKEVNAYVKVFGAFILLAALLISILGRPVNVAANTTQEQAARGVYLGY